MDRLDQSRQIIRRHSIVADMGSHDIGNVGEQGFIGHHDDFHFMNLGILLPVCTAMCNRGAAGCIGT